LCGGGLASRLYANIIITVKALHELTNIWVHHTTATYAPPVNDCDMVIVLARLGNNDYATHSSEQIAVRTQLTCYGWMAYGTSNCYLRVPQ
jgi:hypothetical protein